MCVCAWKKDAGAEGSPPRCLAGAARPAAAPAGLRLLPPPLPGPEPEAAGALPGRAGEEGSAAFGCVDDSAYDKSGRVKGKAGREKPRCLRSQDASGCQRSLLRERPVRARVPRASRGGDALTTISDSSSSSSSGSSNNNRLLPHLTPSLSTPL